MKSYVITTGTVFGLLTVAHIGRVIEEGPQLATQPWYVLITVAAAALCIWALRLLSRWPRSFLFRLVSQPLRLTGADVKLPAYLA